MSNTKARYIVTAGNPPTYYVTPHLRGTDYGYSWMRGRIGKLDAVHFSTQRAAQKALETTRAPRGVERDELQVVRVRVREMFVIRVAAENRTYWLRRAGLASQPHYRWHQGDPGLLAVCRFESREAADAVCASVVGAATARPKVIAMNFIED